MYHVSAQGVDERMINVHYYYLQYKKENTVLNRLHIVRKEEIPVCVACNAVISVEHILMECADLLEIRKKYFKERSLYSLFQNMQIKKKNILQEIGVFYKI